MRIEQSSLSLTSASAKQQTKTVNEQMNAWVDENTNNAAEFQPGSDIATFLSNNIGGIFESGWTDDASFSLSSEEDVQINLLTQMIKALTGKDIKFYIPTRFRQSSQSMSALTMRLLSRNQTAQRAGWGINYTRSETFSENAEMSFSAKGSVKTADGRTIKIDLNLNVSRSFTSSEQVSFKAGDALVDPLVVNFSRGSAELTNQKISFDIDSDGKNDSISFVKSGSGFLVYDKNRNGKADNGSELFGTRTGDGFLELSAYDEDKNGWIDENDSIYNSLQIWTKDANGEDRLFAIGQAGVGAIYLGNVSSAFELKDESNDLQGQIRRTGIFLRENGGAGTIQHVDLSV